MNKRLDGLISQCWSWELSACKDHPIFQPQKFVNILAEEIRKMESSHRRLDNGYYVGFKECKDDVLNLLEDKE